MKTKRILTILLAMCMLFMNLPGAVFAENVSATVYLTVNNKGILAADNSGKAMANREVYVTDIDNDGNLTYNEAMIAAHKAYNREDGYAGEGYVTKLWGIETFNTLFFINHKGLTSGVGVDTVSENDKLVASINKDDVTYADWYSFFDCSEKNVAVNEEFTLNLKGHLGMAWDDASKTDNALADISIGIWQDGVFTPIDEKKTDENGNVTLSFDEANTYCVTADGTVESETTDYNLINLSDGNTPVYGTIDFTTYETQVAYTETDYGDGPYPANEVKYVDFFEWQDNKNDYYALQSNILISDCPIIAPACVVTVADGEILPTSPPEDNEGDNTEKPDVPPATDNDKKDYDTLINEVLEKISEKYINSTSDWVIMDMGAYANYAPETENKLTETAKKQYINTAIKTIKETTSDTAVSKVVLGLAAISKNPELLYSINSNTAVSAIEKLNSIAKSASAWSAPYTLAAYNQGDYETQSFETEIVNALIKNQEEDGSFNEYGTIDTTANVISGLSFYKDRQDVRDAISKAVNYLSTQQNDDGTFSDGYSGKNANSTAMVIIGLTAAGVDLKNDIRFIKNGKTIIDGLMSFLIADGSGFGHTNNETVSEASTEQAFRALIALMQTIKTGQAYNVYDFSKNEFTPARETILNSPPTSPSAPSGDNIEVTLSIKADTGYWIKNYKLTLPKDNATVYHAFVKACNAKTIKYTGAESGYVSSITKGNKTLKEFDKGENSGWLYKVNGELPTKGLTECAISDGDIIVWYYTEDWFQDPNAGSGTPTKKDENTETDKKDEPKEEQKNVDNNTKQTADIKEYKDIDISDWYYNDVKAAMEIGLINGVTQDSFAPGAAMTRAMLVTILYRYDGEKGADSKMNFSDFSGNEWYSEAVFWASENGIVNGYGNGIFAADDMIKRQQLITILYRYAGEKTDTDLSGFADAEKIESWAKDAMMWAIDKKIVLGDDNKLLDPDGFTTRSEAVAIFMRYIQLLNK